MNGLRNYNYRILLAAFLLAVGACNYKPESFSSDRELFAIKDGKPYTRWWWFASMIKPEDIKNQLDWLRQHHFGGVEVAFIYPVNRDPSANRVPWLSEEWTGLVTYTKKYCDSIGLGCDFTFGTLWPFGGTFVADSDRTKIFGDTSFKQPLRLSWTHPDTGNVLDHMNKGAFERYAAVMGRALEPALAGSASALFCDSWEVETKRIWTGGFGEHFNEKYGYRIEPFMDDIFLEENAGPRYDYMKLVSEYVLDNFYLPFTEKCHELNALSRVQCAGSPTDIISAYASVDIPETEAMLYNPDYSRVVASAAALGKKTIVSSETFTCLYGWPAKHIREEQTADLKLVADALFANGTNHIIWHGTPFNPAGVDTVYFYASVHVGKRGSLTKDLIPFNTYMEKVVNEMRKGVTYSDVAVYIAQEDAWIAGEYPPEKQLPWAWGAYEMRYLQFPDELTGYHPLWINREFLQKAELQNKELVVNDLHFKALYIDVEYMDPEALKAILDLAHRGFPVCLKREPKQAGHVRDEVFNTNLAALKKLTNVAMDLDSLNVVGPLVEGKDLPEFWCRRSGDRLIFFFANPLAANLTYPLKYGQSFNEKKEISDIVVHQNGMHIPVQLVFEPYQSVIFTLDEKGRVTFQDIDYRPPVPIQE